MRIQTREFKKLKEQQIDLERGVNLLIGPNGSGKSSFLEYMFNYDSENNCIAYSSGINESFSSIYEIHLNKLAKLASRSFYSYQRGEEESDEPIKFFFTKDWAPFLILVSAYIGREGSLIHKWLDFFGLKISSFDFSIQTSSYYRNKIKASTQNIEKGLLDYGPESSRVHKLLSTFVMDDEQLSSLPKIRLFHGNDNAPLYTQNSRIEDSLYNYLFDTGLFSRIDDMGAKSSVAIKRLFQTLQVISNGKRPIVSLKTSTINFVNSTSSLICLSQLSDGEFQLLLISALIDLFDSENSFFILDEVDAHIHPKLIKDVWSSFDNLAGVAVTSTHNMMTISIADFNRIIFLESGQVVNASTKKNKLVETLCGAFFAEPVWKSLLYTIQTIYIIDGECDWEIFKKLCQKQGFDLDVLEVNSLVVTRSSTTQSANRNDLIKAKEMWVEDFLRSTSKAEVDQGKLKLKNFVLICDSDTYVVNETQNQLDFRTRNQDGYKITSIIWNRRTIENYLISPAARLADNATQPEDFIWGTTMDFGEVSEATLREISRKRMDCKATVQKFIVDDKGLNSERLSAYVERMEDGDIDQYLKRVYEKIVSLVRPAVLG